ncbi:hypothetical protein LTR84_009348 [Exophiala bonariae]|uniref:Transcription factor domain-containing protein n=1 Tax=Exophiala bonariae TaxID=1690606 RepID=A0AAV9MY22_9EURO|nr:hypothetical protein LTR84_009348 [Exophiala bonariae]
MPEIRSEPLPATSSIPFTQQFAFVDGLNSHQGPARKKTRSFVTKQHYRKKRLDMGKKGTGDVRQPSETEILDFRSPVRGQAFVWDSNDEQRRSERSLDSGLFKRLGEGRVDPFDSYPIPATRDVHELVDHYSFVIPSLVHKHWSRAVRRPRSCWDLLKLYRSDEVPFLGMLHHAAHHLARLRGLDMTVQSIEFKQRSLVAVNKSLRRKNGPCNNSILLGVGLLANAERLWGDRDVARLHWGALKRLLIERGGFSALKGEPILHTKIVWSFIALSWPAQDGNPAYANEFTQVLDRPYEISSISSSGFEQSCEELIEFLKLRKMQVLKNLPSTAQQQGRYRACRWRTTTFKDGTSIFAALKQGETGYESPDKRRAVEHCRMACLIYLNLIIAEYGDLSEATEDYLRGLRQISDDENDDSSLTAEHLLWTLLSLSQDGGHYERVGKLCRLTGVLKNLGHEIWMEIGQALRIFLQFPEDNKGLTDILIGWARHPQEFSRLVTRACTKQQTGHDLGENKAIVYSASCSEDCQICPLKPDSY